MDSYCPIPPTGQSELRNITPLRLLTSCVYNQWLEFYPVELILTIQYEFFPSLIAKHEWTQFLKYVDVLFFYCVEITDQLSTCPPLQ